MVDFFPVPLFSQTFPVRSLKATLRGQLSALRPTIQNGADPDLWGLSPWAFGPRTPMKNSYGWRRRAVVWHVCAPSKARRHPAQEPRDVCATPDFSTLPHNLLRSLRWRGADIKCNVCATQDMGKKSQARREQPPYPPLCGALSP